MGGQIMVLGHSAKGTRILSIHFIVQFTGIDAEQEFMRASCPMSYLWLAGEVLYLQ
jgi:hypothetical protein